MKKLNVFLFVSIFMLLGVVNLSYAKAESAITGEYVLKLLTENNKAFQKSSHNFADVSLTRREDTANNGQKPYAIVVTCADSRVPPEHIFSAGVGDLFVIRNAGNIIGTHELGSIEYAVKQLGVKLVLVLGHTKCGAVGAALKSDYSNENNSALQDVVHQIHTAVESTKDAQEAEKLNVENSLKNILTYATFNEYMQENKVLLKGGIYNISTGAVEFFDPSAK